MIPFNSQPDTDTVDQHVQHFLRTHPEVSRKHTVIRRRPRVYEVDGHEVWIEWQHIHSGGFLMVLDGPLRQPFVDYMTMTEANAVYDTRSVAKTSTLHYLPKDKRMTFDDKHERYSRLEAMKVAKEQARLREKAASLSNEGKGRLMEKYNRTLKQRLKHFRPADPDETVSPREGSPLKEDAENIDPVPNVAGNMKNTKQASPMPRADQTSRGPPLPPWASIAPRGISLNGLPVGGVVPPLRSTSYTPVWGGACGSGACSPMPSYSPPPSYAPSPTLSARSPSPARFVVPQPMPRSARELPRSGLPPTLPLSARSGLPVPRTWSGTNMPPCQAMQLQIPTGSIPVAVPTPSSGGGNSPTATPTAVATAILAAPSFPLPVVTPYLACDGPAATSLPTVMANVETPLTARGEITEP